MDSSLACSDFSIMRRCTYLNTDSNSNAYTYSNTDSNAYTNPDSHPYTYSDTHSYQLRTRPQNWRQESLRPPDAMV